MGPLLQCSSNGAISAPGLRDLRHELSQAGDSKGLPRYLFLLGELAMCLGRSGDVLHGLETVDATLARSERNDERWYFAELRLIKGELILLRGEAHAAASAEGCFLRALDWAQRQSTLSWELRAAASLARLLRDRDRAAQGRALLSSVLARFSEGFATADLTDAKSLLEQMA